MIIFCGVVIYTSLTNIEENRGEIAPPPNVLIAGVAILEGGVPSKTLNFLF